MAALHPPGVVTSHTTQRFQSGFRKNLPGSIEKCGVVLTFNKIPKRIYSKNALT